jgi:hypothetical protein
LEAEEEAETARENEWNNATLAGDIVDLCRSHSRPRSI